MINHDCRCPGCGECSAHRNESVLKHKLAEAKKSTEEWYEQYKLALARCGKIESELKAEQERSKQLLYLLAEAREYISPDVKVPERIDIALSENE